MDKVLTELLETDFSESHQKEWFPNEVFIYGTGNVAGDVLNALTVRGIPVSGFLDHHTDKTSFHERKISKPEAIPAKKRHEASVIIGIHNRAANISAIIKNLDELGYQHIVTLIELYDTFHDLLGDRYWLTRRSYYSSHFAEIESASSLWADDASRSLYSTLLRFRLSGKYTLLNQPNFENQYFPPDIPKWKQPIRFVDCGAFDGDTLRSFAEANIPIEALAAFEPDQNNFQKLAKYVQKEEIPNSFLWPCGVYSSSLQLKFSSGQGEASVISEEGTFIIQCIALDEAIPNFKPTLIKMDIEGAEIEALNGAQHIIQKYRPGLAISVYHFPAHIWEIPLLIKKMMPDAYRYFLRAHGFNDFDIVLYAIPI